MGAVGVVAGPGGAVVGRLGLADSADGEVERPTLAARAAGWFQLL